MFHFLYPFYFLLIIPLVLIVFFLYIKWWKSYVFWPMKDLKNVFKKNTLLYKFYYILLFLIFVVYISIFSKPLISSTYEEQIMEWIDIQIVLDVSASMLNSDIQPSRLYVAKEVIWDFVNELNSDRVGLIIFSWKPFTLLPLNFNYEIVKKIIWEISISTIDQRLSVQTALWDAIILASETLLHDQNRKKVLILLTDWEANKWINPTVALKYLQDNNYNIRIYSIWIWWEGGSVLKLLSEKSWWKFFNANNELTLRKIFDEISSLEKTDLPIKKLEQNKSIDIYFLYLLIILFILFLLFKSRKWIS